MLLTLILFSSPTLAQSTEDSTAHKSGTPVISDPTHVGGYGEMALHDPTGFEKPRLDITRFTIDIDHDFSSNWGLESELEIEHVKLERGTGGEIALEEAFLDYHRTEQIGWRGGLLLIPMGITNQTHEPNTFLSVDRPLFDQVVIPTTWREIGTGIYGSLSKGVQYQLYITEGLITDSITMDGLGSGKQEGSAGTAASDKIAGSDASHPAVSAKLDFLPLAGLRIGASAYLQQGHTQDFTRAFFMAVCDARYEHGPLHLQGEFGIVSTGDASDFVGVPAGARGGYAEVAYNVFYFIAAQSELLPFVRYENFSFTGRDTATGSNFFGAGPSVRHISVTAGVAFKPLDNLILKADYRSMRSDGTPEMDQFSLGMGYSY